MPLSQQAGGADADPAAPSAAPDQAGGIPDTVECATCGGRAPRVTWGSSIGHVYRCRECHAGGELVVENGTAYREGGVFEALNNYATRQLRGDQDACPADRRRAES